MAELLTLTELVAMPTLGQTVLAGAQGLDRVVLWAHSCEMSDPWSWLGPDELLMTTGPRLPAAEADQVEFVRRLAGAHLSGMTIGDCGMPTLTPAMLEEADRLAFPVLSTSHEVPFVVLSRTVALAGEAGQAQQLVRLSRLYRALNQVPSSPSEALRSVENTFGIRMAVADAATGAVLFPGTLNPQPETVREMSRLARAQTEFQPRGLSGSEGRLRSWPLPAARKAILLTEEADNRMLDSFALAHLKQAVTAAVNNVLSSAMLTLARGEHLVSLVLAGRLPADALADRCREFGLVEGEMAVLAAATDNPDDLLVMLYAARVPHVSQRLPDRLVICVSRQAEQQTLDAVSPLSSGVGVSPPFTALSDLDDAIGKATWALAAVPGNSGDIARYEEIRGSVLPRDGQTAREIVQAVLGSLTAPGARNERLLRTLECYLANGRSWAATADQLKIHRQSLAYRLQQIETATGRDLKGSRDLAELWIAVAAHQLFARTPST